MAKTPKMGTYYPQPHYEDEEEEEFEEEDEFDEEEDNFDEEDDGFDEQEEEEQQQESENAEQIEKKLPEQKAETKSITVKVKNPRININDGTMMKIDEDIQLRWLMIHYCEKKAVERSSVRFFFNGVVVRDTDTPLQLSMVDRDVIYLFPKDFKPEILMRNETRYKTLCLRMHKRRDTFLRVISTDRILPQLKRHFSYGKAGKSVSACFVYNGQTLSDKEHHSAYMLGIEDGDVIDAFDFAESSSSFSIITPPIAPVTRHLTLRSVNDQWGGPFDIRVKGNAPLKEVALKYVVKIFGFKLNVNLFHGGRQLSLDKTVEEERLYDGSVLMVHENIRKYENFKC